MKEDAMDELVRVKSVSVFDGSAEGRLIQTGDEFEVTPARAAELAANGLVMRLSGLMPGEPMMNAPHVPLPPANGAAVLGETDPHAETGDGAPGALVANPTAALAAEQGSTVTVEPVGDQPPGTPAEASGRPARAPRAARTAAGA
jgi:hypothetical protein